MSDIEELVKKANACLDLKREIVGVKLLKTEEYNASTAKEIPVKMNYCVLVKTAMMGKSLKASLNRFGCMSSARSLGLVSPDEKWLSGCFYNDKSIHKDIETAKSVVEDTTSVSERSYGVMVQPLELFTEEPDVVLVTTTPYNMMRLVQGYTYNYGAFTSFKMVGMQALCSELTAFPLENDDVNVSVFCAGTRFMAGWGEDEMGLGIPFHKFGTMIDGLYDTVNIMEPNKKKKVIEEKLKENNFNDLEIEYNKNYYTGLYMSGK